MAPQLEQIPRLNLDRILSPYHPSLEELRRSVVDAGWAEPDDEKWKRIFGRKVIEKAGCRRCDNYIVATKAWAHRLRANMVRLVAILLWCKHTHAYIVRPPKPHNKSQRGQPNGSALCADCREVTSWDWRQRERRICPFCGAKDSLQYSRGSLTPLRYNKPPEPDPTSSSPTFRERYTPEKQERYAAMVATALQGDIEAINDLAETYQAGEEWALGPIEGYMKGERLPEEQYGDNPFQVRRFDWITDPEREASGEEYAPHSQRADFLPQSGPVSKETSARTAAIIGGWAHFDRGTGTEYDVEEVDEEKIAGEKMTSYQIDPAVSEQAMRAGLIRAAAVWRREVDGKRGKNFLDYAWEAVYHEVIERERETYGRPVRNVTVKRAAELLGTSRRHIIERIHAELGSTVIRKKTIATLPAGSFLAENSWLPEWMQRPFTRTDLAVKTSRDYEGYTLKILSNGTLGLLPLPAIKKGGQYRIRVLTDDKGRKVYPRGRYIPPETKITALEALTEYLHGEDLSEPYVLEQSQINTKGMTPGMQRWLDLRLRLVDRQVSHKAAAQFLGLSEQTIKNYSAELRKVPLAVYMVKGEGDSQNDVFLEPFDYWGNPDLTPYNAAHLMIDPEWEPVLRIGAGGRAHTDSDGHLYVT